MARFSLDYLKQHFSEDIQALNPDLFEAPQVAARPMENKPEGPHGNKYGAHKVKIGDQIFDSGKEARRWLVLHGQQEQGEISDLRCQVRYELLPGFGYYGERIRAINYTADFVYVRQGITYIEDIKSAATARTESFRIRWRLLQHKFKDDPDVRCIVVD